MVVYDRWDNGRKAVVWNQYEWPTFEEVCEVARRLFPGVPHRELVFTAEVDNDGHSVEASVVLTPR